MGPKTKQLVADLATLRNLLRFAYTLFPSAESSSWSYDSSFLLSYDPIAFHAYLETIISSNTTTESGAPRQHRSPWLFTDAANIIFRTAKRRCYIPSAAKKAPKEVIEISDDEEAWDALDELEGTVGTSNGPSAKDKGKGKQRQKWLPKGMEPVLEELPKWSLLADVLQEIEEEMIRLESSTSFCA